MAIFSRRTIQRLIDENASFLNKAQLENHVKKLNEGDLSFEWEVVLLNVFSKLGNVVHEPKFANCSRKIDVLFSSKEKDEIKILADITTISDKFAETENPVEYLEDKLLQIAIKKKLPGGFGFSIGGNTAQDTFLRKKQELFIPSKKDFDREVFFSAEFKEFINEILQKPYQSSELYITKDRIQLRIIYSLNGITSSTFSTYTEIISLEDNSIWKALIRKYKQLKGTKYKGHIGIIICDGDCESIRSVTSSWYSKTSGDVIRRFLSKKTRVSFVLIIYVEQSTSFSGKNKIVCNIFKGKQFDEKLEDFFSYFLKSIEKLFPIPERTPMNAVNFLKAKLLFQENASLNEGESFFGGGVISNNKIKISSRTLLDVLAGKISYDEFPDEYKNFFNRKLTEKKLINELEFEKQSENDDDWIIFKFGEQDLAISPFTVPNMEE